MKMQQELMRHASIQTTHERLRTGHGEFEAGSEWEDR